MLQYALGVVSQENSVRKSSTQELDVVVKGVAHRVVNYIGLTGHASVGDEVVINVTAGELGLGTGGVDFLMANLTKFRSSNAIGVYTGCFIVRPYRGGHIIKGRYTPLQQAVLTLEEQERHADVWEKKLDGFPVLVGQLHSQIAPAAAALHLGVRLRVAYIMTDAAALPLEFSTLVHQLKQEQLLNLTITCGQAFGGDWETVTLHSALLAAKHIGECDAAIVCQGPGNAGTGTKYGFSGIEQAQNLDIVSALGGKPIAIVRMSSADKRERHQGISHHTRTALELAHSRCIVPLPTGTDAETLSPRHDIRFVAGVAAAMERLETGNIHVTTMGRTYREDPDFFLAAAAAGLVTFD